MGTISNREAAAAGKIGGETLLDGKGQESLVDLAEQARSRKPLLLISEEPPRSLFPGRYARAEDVAKIMPIPVLDAGQEAALVDLYEIQRAFVEVICGPRGSVLGQTLTTDLPPATWNGMPLPTGRINVHDLAIDLRRDLVIDGSYGGVYKPMSLTTAVTHAPVHCSSPGCPYCRERVATVVRDMLRSLGCPSVRDFALDTALRADLAAALMAHDPTAPPLPDVGSARVKILGCARIFDALCNLFRDLGVEPGMEIPNALRAAVLSALGFVEPPAPPWVKPGAYAYTMLRGLRGSHVRIASVSSSGILLDGSSDPLPMGRFLASYEPENEAHPVGLPCKDCGQIRNDAGFCYGCVDKVRERALAALRRGGGYTERPVVEIDGYSVSGPAVTVGVSIVDLEGGRYFVCRGGFEPVWTGPCIDDAAVAFAALIVTEAAKIRAAPSPRLPPRPMLAAEREDAVPPTQPTGALPDGRLTATFAGITFPIKSVEPDPDRPHAIVVRALITEHDDAWAALRKILESGASGPLITPSRRMERARCVSWSTRDTKIEQVALRVEMTFVEDASGEQAQPTATWGPSLAGAAWRALTLRHLMRCTCSPNIVDRHCIKHGSAFRREGAPNAAFSLGDVVRAGGASHRAIASGSAEARPPSTPSKPDPTPGQVWRFVVGNDRVVGRIAEGAVCWTDGNCTGLGEVTGDPSWTCIGLVLPDGRCMLIGETWVFDGRFRHVLDRVERDAGGEATFVRADGARLSFRAGLISPPERWRRIEDAPASRMPEPGIILRRRTGEIRTVAHVSFLDSTTNTPTIFFREPPPWSFMPSHDRDAWETIGIETSAGRVMVGEKRRHSDGHTFAVVGIIARASWGSIGVLIREENGEEHEAGAYSVALCPLVEVGRASCPIFGVAMEDGEDGEPVRVALTDAAIHDYVRSRGETFASGLLFADNFARMNEALAGLRSEGTIVLPPAARMRWVGPEALPPSSIASCVCGWSGAATALAPDPLVGAVCPSCRRADHVRIEHVAARPSIESLAAGALLADGFMASLAADIDRRVAEDTMLPPARPVDERTQRRREIEAVLDEDARQHPQHAAARRAAVLAAIEGRDLSAPVVRTLALDQLHLYEAGRASSPTRELARIAEEIGGNVTEAACSLYERARTRKRTPLSTSTTPVSRRALVRSVFPRFPEQTIAEAYGALKAKQARAQWIEEPSPIHKQAPTIYEVDIVIAAPIRLDDPPAALRKDKPYVALLTRQDHAAENGVYEVGPTGPLVRYRGGER